MAGSPVVNAAAGRAQGVRPPPRACRRLALTRGTAPLCVCAPSLYSGQPSLPSWELLGVPVRTQPGPLHAPPSQPVPSSVTWSPMQLSGWFPRTRHLVAPILVEDHPPWCTAPLVSWLQIACTTLQELRHPLPPVVRGGVNPDDEELAWGWDDRQ